MLGDGAFAGRSCVTDSTKLANVHRGGPWRACKPAAAPHLETMDDGIPDRHTRLRDARAFRRAALAAGGFVMLLWWVHLVAWYAGRSLLKFGVYPQDPVGLIGVLTAPLIHGSWSHLVSNTLPMLVLGTLALYAYPRASRLGLPLIWILSGLGTWLIGRESSHIGASGLGHGLMFFLFVLGVLRWEPRSIAVALVTFLLYGGMLLTVLPREPGVSWEYHLSGALAGVLAAVLWRRRDPLPPRKKYSWEIEEELAREAAAREVEPFEPPRPDAVPVLWVRPAPDEAPRVLQFPGHRARPPGAGPMDEDPPTPTRH
jgi:membrane associated rhomboid family serine protease